MSAASVPWFAIALALPGLLLIAWGICGRRVGSEPRCRRCGYELTGLPHATCPECGTDYTATLVRIGVLQRRRRAIALGFVLMAVGVAGGSRWVRSIDWYRRMPFRAALWLADRGNARAFQELRRRFRTEALSQADVSTMVAVALDKQASATLSDPNQEWINLLEAFDYRGLLPDEQHELYRRQFVGPYRLEVRSPIGASDPLVVEPVYLKRGPNAGTAPMTYPMMIRQHIAVNGTPIPHDAIEGQPPVTIRAYEGVVEWRGHVTAPGPWSLGRHQLEYRLDIAIWRGHPTPSTFSQLTARAHFDVVGAQPSVRLVPDDALAEALHAAVSARRLGPVVMPNGLYLGVRIETVQPMPVTVAFDVLARDEDGEVYVGTYWCRKGSADGHFRSVRRLDDLQPRQRQIVLRASADVALRTIDLREIWDGELILAPLLLGRYIPDDEQSIGP